MPHQDTQEIHGKAQKQAEYPAECTMLPLTFYTWTHPGASMRTPS